MQPVVHATTRTPGPSTVEPVVNECRNPMSPVARAVRTSDSGQGLAGVDAKLEWTVGLERPCGDLALRHGGLPRGTSG